MSVLSNVELVMWSPVQGAEPPLVAVVRDSLIDGGFNADRAGDVADTTAFRRAVKELETHKHLRTTVWSNGTLHAQLDRLVESDGRIRREYVTGWTMNASGNVDGTEPLNLLPHKVRYTWADVSGVIQAILMKDGLGAYTPRRAGGIYFVPVVSRDMLDRLEAALRAVNLNLLRYQVPDTTAQREEVRDAITGSLANDVTEHGQAIAGYSIESTRAGVVANRREAIAASRALVMRLAVHLGEQGATLIRRLLGLDAQCAQLIERIEAFRPVTTSRRIVGVSPEVAHAG